MEGTADKFPERLEVGKTCVFGSVLRGRCIVNVGRDPDHIADAAALDEGQQLGHFELAPGRCAVVPVGPGFVGALRNVRIEIGHDDRQRHVARDDFPGCARIRQLLLEPLHLRGAQEIGVAAGRGLPVCGVRAAVAAFVQHQHVDQGAHPKRSVDPLRVDRIESHRVVFEHRAVGAGGQQ